MFVLFCLGWLPIADCVVSENVHCVRDTSRLFKLELLRLHFHVLPSLLSGSAAPMRCSSIQAVCPHHYRQSMRRCTVPQGGLEHQHPLPARLHRSKSKGGPPPLCAPLRQRPQKVRGRSLNARALRRVSLYASIHLGTTASPGALRCGAALASTPHA